MPGLSDVLAAQRSCNEMQENGRALAGRHRAVIKAPTSPDAGCGCIWKSLAPTVTWREPSALGRQPLQGAGPLPRLCPEGGTWQQSSPPIPPTLLPLASTLSPEPVWPGRRRDLVDIFRALLLLFPHWCRDRGVPEVPALGVQDRWVWLCAPGVAQPRPSLLCCFAEG